ncbi:MAG: methylamine utilization protein [Planctomycetota bacterium]
MSRFPSLSTLCFAATCLVVGLSSATSSAETGTLRIKFTLKGDAKNLPPLKPNVDQAFCGKEQIPDESLLVNPEDNGIKNVIVYVYTGRRGGTKLPKMELKAETHILANEACRFEPHVVIAKKGDTIKVTNPDKVGHNANFSFLENKPANPTIPAGGEVEIELKEAEPAPIPVACNIHSWMKAQIVVMDHPFSAVSNENGVLEISGLPTGEIVFRANHETGSLKDVVVNGKKTSWRASRFEMDIKPGMNDMGVVEIPLEAFDNN